MILSTAVAASVAVAVPIAGLLADATNNATPGPGVWGIVLAAVSPFVTAIGLLWRSDKANSNARITDLVAQRDEAIKSKERAANELLAAANNEGRRVQEILERTLVAATTWSVREKQLDEALERKDQEIARLTAELGRLR